MDFISLMKQLNMLQSFFDVLEFSEGTSFHVCLSSNNPTLLC